LRIAQTSLAFQATSFACKGNIIQRSLSAAFPQVSCPAAALQGSHFQKKKAKLEMKGQVKYGYKPLTDFRNYHKK